MPQLDISTYSAQLFWLAVLFAFLFFVIQFYFTPSIRKIFKARELRLRKQIVLAKQMKREIEGIEQEIIDKEHYAHDHIRSLVHEAEIASQKAILKRKHELSLAQNNSLKALEKELEELQMSFLTSQKEEETLTRLLIKQLIPFSLSDAVYKEALEQKDLSAHVA